MADFRHISKALSQQNKAHKGASRGRSAGGKVEVSLFTSIKQLLCEYRQEL